MMPKPGKTPTRKPPLTAQQLAALPARERARRKAARAFLRQVLTSHPGKAGAPQVVAHLAELDAEDAADRSAP